MKEGKIVYKFTSPAYPNPNILYINLISKYSCVNDCLFCSRPRSEEDFGKPNIYEKKAQSFLYLSRPPSVKRILGELGKEIGKSTEEIAIIGLGEPLIYFDKVVRLLKEIKKRYPESKGFDFRTRIDTNGQVLLWEKNAVKKLEGAGLDEIRISLNAVNEKEYNQLCRPKNKNAFRSIARFLKECNKSKINTFVSFVVNFEHAGIKERPKKECIRFARSLGIKRKNIILRKYIKPIG